MSTELEVRCCCKPENCIGYLPEDEGLSAGLEKRELNDGTFAFSSEDRDDIPAIPGFIEAAKKPKPKTWKK